MGSIDEGCEDVADRAMARAWAALSPARFASFPNLATLMGYLRTCVSATAIDMARARAVRERAYQKLNPATTATPEQVVMDELERADLWRAFEEHRVHWARPWAIAALRMWADARQLTW